MTVSPVPIPSITGGAAGPSGAQGGTIRNSIMSISGGGNGLWFAMAAIVLGIVWMKRNKK